VTIILTDPEYYVSPNIAEEFDIIKITSMAGKWGMEILTIVVSLLYCNDARLVYEYFYVSFGIESLAFSPYVLAFCTFFLLLPTVAYLTTYKWIHFGLQGLMILHFISVCVGARCR